MMAREPERSTRARAAKRLMDILGAGALLLVTLPLVACAAIAIRVVSPGPVLFRQPRIGRGGRPFMLLKLRSMHRNADDLLQLHLARVPSAAGEWDRYRRLRDDPRVLPYIGRLLRGSSIDELPQLWNVLVGDMSLVGPRPLEVPVVRRLGGPLIQRRHRVRPGLTGLWQVSGRSDLDLAALISLDASYLEQWSLWTDLVILCRTPAAIVSRRGAY